MVAAEVALARVLLLIIFRDSRRGLVVGAAVEVGAVLTMLEGTGSRLITGIEAVTLVGSDPGANGAARRLLRVGVGSFTGGG